MKTNDAPAIVTVIPRATIVAMGYRSVAEALSSVPGFYVADDLVTSNISVRGTHGGPDSWSRMLKVMINGHPATYYTTGGNLLGDEFLPIDAVDSIEVIRGTGSALYGANAFLGVINVITRHPESPGMQLRLSGESGVTNNRNWGGSGDVSGSVAFGDKAASYLSFALRGGRFDRSGLAVPATSPDGRNFTGVRSENDISRPRSVFADGRFDLGRLGSLHAQYLEQTLDAYGEFSSNSVLTHDNRIAMRNQVLGLSHRLALLGDHLNINTMGTYAYGADLPYERLDGGSGGYTIRRERSSSTTTVGSDVSYSRWGHTALLGYEYQNLHDSGDMDYMVLRDDVGVSTAGTQISGTPSPQTNVTDHGLIGQLILRPMDRLTLIGGMRYAWNDTWGNSANYRLGATYHVWEGLWAKLIYGTSYVPPAPSQLQQMPLTVQYGIVGNPDLKSQKASTGEVELSYEFANRFSLAVNGFHTRIDNRVEFVYSGTQLSARNVVPSQTYGFEAEGRFFWRQIFSTINVSYQHTAPMETPPLNPLWWQVLYSKNGPGSDHSLYHPTWISHWELGGTYAPAHSQASLRFTYIGSRKSSMANIMENHGTYLLPSHVVLDFTIKSLELKLLQGKATVVSLHVNNVLDSHYAEPGALGVDIPSLGRSWFLRLSQEF
jgi:outer membrane receptor for ferrienterochelin and colicins